VDDLRLTARRRDTTAACPGDPGVMVPGLGLSGRPLVPAERELVRLAEVWDGESPEAEWGSTPCRSTIRRVATRLDAVPPYDEIRLALFSHGTDSAGLATVEQWQEVLRRGRRIDVFAGADPQRSRATSARWPASRTPWPRCAPPTRCRTRSRCRGPGSWSRSTAASTV
jgi:hypothetical protein